MNHPLLFKENIFLTHVLRCPLVEKMRSLLNASSSLRLPQLARDCGLQDSWVHLREAVKCQSRVLALGKRQTPG